jgi:hypothetical protein
VIMSRTVPSQQIKKKEAIGLLLERGADKGRHPAVREAVRIVPSKQRG